MGKSETVGGRILIVDDYPANVKLLERNLQASGYQTVAAYDGEEALEKVEADKPDLILLDIMLPKIDGFEVCHRLRADETTAVIPIIMITALKETEDRIRGLEAGADDFISKPFDRGELLARVKSLLQIKYYRSMLAEREKFHAVIQDLSHGIIIAGPEGDIQTISRRAAELLGHAGENLVGRTIAQALEGWQVEPGLQALQSSRTHSVTVELSQTVARPRYLAGRWTRIEGPGGQLYNVALVFRDITDTRRREQVKHGALMHLTHKLRSPLTSIKGYVCLMQQGKLGTPPEEMRKAIDTVAVSVAELEERTNKLLAYAGLASTEIDRAGQLVDPAELVGRVVDQIDHRYTGRHIEWDLGVPAGLAQARAPEEQLAVVLDNLADNAVKFTPGPAPHVGICVTEMENHWLRFAVTDNGPGIAPEHREQIFADFLQLEEEFTGNIAGMGLGLAIAKQLVESWGGEIDVESRRGEGATFSFTVPSEHAPAGDQQE